MDNNHAEDHNPHIGPDAHLPDPSIWPLLVGLGMMFLGAAITWWVRDSDSDFAGPVLGAAIATILVISGGWAYEDSRMKRAAEAHGPRRRDARFTQVVSFAVAEGQFEAARGPEGIISRIDSADTSLRDLAGFQDLRISASPAASGPSQVLVETTWSDRDGLATYDQTRQTVLDMVAESPEQVVPGTVQVFDMEVVRDTKDTAFRFGTGAAATLIGGLAIGGLLIGAGLTLFESDAEGTATGGGGGGGENGGGAAPPPSGFAQTGTIHANNIAFDIDAFSLPPETEVTLTFENQESIPHNFEVFAGPEFGGDLLTGCTAGCPGDEVATEILTGPDASVQFTFTTPGPGEYAFWCLLHPDQMRGTMTIEEGAPVPGQAAPPADGEGGGEGGEGEGGAAGGAIEIAANNMSFSTDSFNVTAGSEVTLTFENQESLPHNFEIFASDSTGGDLLTGCTSGCPGDEVSTEILSGPDASVTITFTAPEAGEYAFWCLLHPSDMVGVMNVT